MQPTALLAALPLLVAACSAPVHTEPTDRPAATATDPSNFGMQVVSNDASPRERAHGWRYFSEPAAYRAVVISPQGDYYYSHGGGLHWVAGAPTRP